jgi:RNA polymerase sigma-70 factor (ECF subfamily)
VRLKKEDSSDDDAKVAGIEKMRTLRREMERVYDQYGSQLFTCALAVTGCHDLAEDAIHEAFCRGFRLTEIPRNPKAYMFRSVRNAAIDQLRKRSRTSSLSEEYIFDSSPGPGELAEQRQFKRRAAQVLLKLSEDERETIVQHLYADLTFQEIADLRERPLGTITSWYRRGLAKMKEYMEH